MSRKHFDIILANVFGISGYGIFTISIHWNAAVFKFILAMITALCAGALGYLGQLTMKWIIKKVNKKPK